MFVSLLLLFVVTFVTIGREAALADVGIAVVVDEGVVLAVGQLVELQNGCAVHARPIPRHRIVKVFLKVVARWPHLLLLFLLLPQH